ncbi:uncharacterized protein PV09_01813 [Verruconis gallopava]|uniref:Exosome complex protein n=1 Tax=Verruconis gallopava TaxID=253628 RepID=A0A0D2AMC9_9PEZI|nr:uncharacterized protein PV09_01813 [Verruconis gallopava]KIW07903.1 hypothetical protein PV09_01813 [Verruconis gallopava]
MDTSAASDLVDDLSANIDELTAALQPLITKPIDSTASTFALPIDKAKFYALSTYAIGSILHSYERLSAASNPQEYRSHPVMTELKRVQQYMQKIDAIENPIPVKTLDTAAAGRFVKAGLAGNDKYDAQKAGKIDGDKMAAKRKLEEMPGYYEAEIKKSKSKKKKSRRSEHSVLDVDEKDLELVKPIISQEQKSAEKKNKKATGGLTGT